MDINNLDLNFLLEEAGNLNERAPHGMMPLGPEFWRGRINPNTNAWHDVPDVYWENLPDWIPTWQNWSNNQQGDWYGWYDTRPGLVQDAPPLFEPHPAFSDPDYGPPPRTDPAGLPGYSVTF